MSNKILAFLTIPGLRVEDVEKMPNLKSLGGRETIRRIQHSFPAVTWPSQAATLTGKLPREHGVVANGFFWRETSKVEMWTAWNEKIQAPQIWDLLHKQDPNLTSAAWFPMLSKGCGADYICMPAPIHKPDGSEELWCYTRPQPFYGELKDKLGHFPLQHFWGPLANIKSTAWIIDSVSMCAQKFKPRFLYIYLPHLDYAAQKLGPNSAQALQAVQDLDAVIGTLKKNLSEAYAGDQLAWMVASEYVIQEVNHVAYPNRTLRGAGLLQLQETADGKVIDFANTPAWALVDHQFSHVFVKDRNADVIEKIVGLFQGQQGIREVLSGSAREKYGLNHERAGDVILVSEHNSWQAYYWWTDDAEAPKFARTVDIHKKPGYDPVELHVDMATRSIPLNADLIKGSHGAPADRTDLKGALVSNDSALLGESAESSDLDFCDRILKWFAD